MLQLQEVSKTYKLKSGLAVKALQKVSVNFQEKGLVFILGKSGSGKSTMLNVIGGLDQVDEGEIIIKGKSSKTFKNSDFDNYRNTFIGFVFQEYNLIEDFTIGKNIALALELQGHKATPELVHNILNEVDMVGYENRRVNQISSGQKQRVAIARALIKNPQIILADEPTGALDSATGKQVLELLKKLSSDKLVIVVSHDIETANVFGDRIIELKDGEIINDVTKVKNPTKDIKKGIKQNQNIVCLDEDYKLKESDLKLLQKLHEENETLVITKKHELLDTYTFDNTKVDEINQQTYDGSLLKFIKSKLKNLDSFKIGASGLKHKRFRLFMTILLSFVSLSFFALTDTMSAFDANDSHLRTLSNNNINRTNLAQSLKDDNGSLFGSYYTYGFTDEKIDKIKSELSKASISPIINEQISLSFDLYNIELTDGNNVLVNTIAWASPKTVLIDSNFLSQNNYTLLAGTFPSNENEYLITSFALDVYTRLGFSYYEIDNGNVTHSYIYPNAFTNNKVTNANLLFDKSFNESQLDSTISGVINIDYDVDRFSEESLADIKNDYNKINILSNYVSENNLLGFHAKRTRLNNFYYQDEGVSDKYYPNDARLLFEEDRFEYTIDLPVIIKESDLKDDLLIKFDNAPIKDDEIIISYQVLTNYFFQGENFYIYNDYETFSEPSLHLKTGNTNLEFSSINEFINWSKNANNTLILKNLINSKVSSLEVNNPLSGSKQFAKYKIAGLYFPTESYIEYNNELIYYFEYWTSAFAFSVSTQTQKRHFPISFVYELQMINNDTNLLATYQKLLSFEDEIFKFTIYSEFSEVFSTFGFLFEILTGVFLVLGIILAIFSSLLMMNFIALSIAFKKRDIGILRGLGASKTDVIKIFGFESLIIASINIVLAMIICIIAVVAINQKVALELGAQITFLAFTFRQIVLIIGIALFSAAIASVLPVLKIARKKPIDAIYDR
ncbi:MAG: ATP-binding cassette domain-containing protein [Bacilli bacterium]|jgi:ABC-type lipoprotein export system ATPase subunit/ABC-type antimicrobial peptide transport system permease subunit|nr:ATP-binding cassette domain-containing protein [Bacilli bacterium]